MKVGDHHALTPATDSAGAASIRNEQIKTSNFEGLKSPALNKEGRADLTTVQLSPEAFRLMSGEGIEFNTAKIEQMRQAISEGRFEFNPDAVADKLIANVQELLSGRR